MKLNKTTYFGFEDLYLTDREVDEIFSERSIKVIRKIPIIEISKIISKLIYEK
jgi:hypothetical protein